MEEFLGKNMDLGRWIEIEDEEYRQEHPPDFMTHLNYVSCVNAISEKISISCNLSLNKKINESKFLRKKINLIKLTTNSIRGEYNTILKNSDYAELCVSWISVKSYYLIFNLLLILDYLISGQESSFNSAHKQLLKRFKNYLDNKSLSFDKKFFNKNFPCYGIISIKCKVGSNIKVLDFDLKERIVQILKKLVCYKLEELQRDEKIKNFRTKKAKEGKKKFLNENTVNIFEFFYWYRIKANYRDLEFLNKDIGSDKFKEFYKNYYELTLTYLNAFKQLINQLAMVRLGRSIL
jgi:hypothetical protein